MVEIKKEFLEQAEKIGRSCEILPGGVEELAQKLQYAKENNKPLRIKLGMDPTRPDLHLGICGEHGGNPASVEFCHKIGLDYVSCSPYRVPIARLAAAQAAIKNS